MVTRTVSVEVDTSISPTVETAISGRDIPIRNDTDYKRAETYLVCIRGAIDAINARFEAPEKRLREAAKELRELKRESLSALDLGRRAIESRIGEYLRSVKDRTASNGDVGCIEEFAEAIERGDIVDEIITLPTDPRESFTTRETWSADVVDEEKLREAYKRGDVSDDAFTPNKTFLNKEARKWKTDFSIPGVEAVCNTSVVKKRS
jgi:hypothetical protein